MPVIVFIWSLFTFATVRNVLEVHPIQFPPLEPRLECNEKRGCTQWGDGKPRQVERILPPAYVPSAQKPVERRITDGRREAYPSMGVGR
jgi:hypothetical protein